MRTGTIASEVFDRRVFPPGKEIFAEGEPGTTAYLVQSGAVEIYKRRPDGETVLGRIAPGGIFGEMALIDRHPRMASARAAEETVCLVIPHGIIEKKLAKADPFLVALIRIFVGNVRSLAAR